MAKKPSDPVWLYKDGVTSPIIGGWNNAGYKYGSAFAQSQDATKLRIYSTSQYNNRGGRTFTTNLQIPADFINKSIHVKGSITITTLAGRNNKGYVFISETVQDASSTEDVASSGAFTNAISKYFESDNMAIGTTKTFELVIELTKVGYLSLVGYKGYNGYVTVNFEEVWVE